MENLDILLTGDLMPGGEFDRQVRNGSIPVNRPFDKVRVHFENSHLVLANFECPIRWGENTRPDKSSILGCPEDILPYLKKWNFNILSLANNHIHDYGRQGVIHTLERLEKYGLLQVGLNSHDGKLKNFVKQKIKNRNIGIAAFTSDEPWIKSKLNDDPYNLVFYSRTNIKRIIANLRESCDFVIIIMHWGFEKHQYPSPLQVKIAEFCIDEGADVVVGHHPHMVQGYRIYKGKPVFFSLGHLFFPDFCYKSGDLYQWKEKNRYGLLVELTLRKKDDLSFKLIPIFQGRDFQVEELEANAREEFLKHLDSISGKMDLPPKKYSRFWRGHHFSVRKAQLLPNIKSAFKGPNPTRMRRFIRMGKLFLLFVDELVKWLLAITPEKESRYV